MHDPQHALLRSVTVADSHCFRRQKMKPSGTNDWLTVLVMG